MANQDWQNVNGVQKLLNSCERRVGLARFTEKTIGLGPDALMKVAFDYLITQLVDSFTIYESLDCAYRTADMVLTDPINTRAIAPFTGQEIISIAYKSGITSTDSKEKIIHFRVHNISEQGTDSGLQSGFKKLSIKLVEFPAFHMFTSNQFYKTYPIDEDNSPKLRLSDIVKDCLKDIKNFSDWYDVDIEDSEKDTINFFIPNWNVMKTINFCKKYAISENKKYPMYVFHIGNVAGKDRPIVYFKPVFSFIDNSKKFRAYGTSIQDVNKDTISNTGVKVYSPTDTINSYSFDYFDALRTVEFSGTTEVSFDYIEDNSYICNNYNNFIQSKYKGISPFVLHQPSYGNQWSKFYKSSWNKKEAELLIRNENFNDYSANILMGGVRCNANCFMFEGRSVGERAELMFNINNTDKIFDEMMSGAWLTWSITDSFINGVITSTITFISDSFVNIGETGVLQKINTITNDLNPESIEQG